MALTDFFRINLPYGIVQDSKGRWLAFNREYMPLGWNKKDLVVDLNLGNVLNNIPIYTEYKGITEKKLLEIAGNEKFVMRDTAGKINRIFLYDDRTNPQSSNEYWNDYFSKIKLLSRFERK
jgi:hypothetical protein